MTYTIFSPPLGKPRQTQRDRWQQRPCVLAYRAWADLARLTVWKKNQKQTLTKPTMVHVTAYFAPRGKQHCVGPHTHKPDADNCLKACLDALFVNDEMVYETHCTKLWADCGRPRIIVEIS